MTAPRPQATPQVGSVEWPLWHATRHSHYGIHRYAVLWRIGRSTGFPLVRRSAEREGGSRKLSRRFSGVLVAIMRIAERHAFSVTNVRENETVDFSYFRGDGGNR
jgi:hypothetical protein